MQAPVAFGVFDARFDDEHASVLLAGRVPAGARVEPGMKLSVAVNPLFAVELPVGRVEEVGSAEGVTWLLVWVEALGHPRAGALRRLGLENEELVVWQPAARVDPARHFAC